MKKFIEYIKRDRKIIALSLICGIIISAGISTKSYAERVSREISDSVIRFHVLADSDEEYDQQLKLKVRDSILELLYDGMENCKSRDEAEKYLASHSEDIKNTTEKVIAAEGYDYGVTVSLSEENYPVRYYGDTVFPAGEYLSLRVIIGSGEGHNWWCVMYPPLCLNGEGVEYKDSKMLKEVLSEDGYEVVVLSADNAVPEMKFKIVEWWTSLSE
ncbi:MAG: stage II sporulation protein R [Clostridia bacterium]|nr:stage II sporulation protein R [Clostridia bacterium]